MKFMQTVKDGGEESHVWAHVLIELKGWFSIMVLRFEPGSRAAYHSHAFNCFSWILRGKLEERLWRHWPKAWGCPTLYWRRPSWRPFITRPAPSDPAPVPGTLRERLVRQR